MTQVAAKNNFIKTMIADLNLTGTFFDFRGVGKGGGDGIPCPSYSLGVLD